MKKVIFVTDIPAPYRIDFYNNLYAAGFDFEVWYMQANVKSRSWVFDAKKMHHPYIINYGFYTRVGRFNIFFNPSMIFKLLLAKDAEVVLAASWNDLNVLLFSALKRLRILRARLHFWSEANYLTIGSRHDNKLKAFLRWFVYDASPGVQVCSGKMTQLTFDRWGFKGRTYASLPNTIEENLFTLRDSDLAMRKCNQLPVILISARLIEKIKGVINFLSAVGDANLRHCKILIAGDGQDREATEGYVRSMGIENYVEILGDCSIEQMVALYRRANVFCLPSFTDASPLSVIEALRMRLPLLVSERCGNYFEALVSGENGYLFDPDDSSSIRHAFLTLLARREEWEQMGNISGQRYDRIFKRDVVISNFIKEFSTVTDSLHKAIKQ